jgi:hypothetical protein
MARVTQLIIQAEDKPGMLATICSELAKVAVNISAVMASHEPPAGIRILAAPLPAARKVLDHLRIPYSEEEAIAIRITDRPGALGKATRKLGERGINIRYAYGSIVKGESRALVVLGVSDVGKADEVL